MPTTLPVIDGLSQSTHEPKSPNSGPNRNLQLDCLRCVAFVLVLIQHAHHKDHTGIQLVDSIRQGSWMGVDLFFVLSGFLVSGLLFKQVYDGSRPDVTRFLIRRGFKIYPSYFLLLVTVWFMVSPSMAHGIKLFTPAVFFFQNFQGSHLLLFHTWSLAVEEHFYVLLAFVFFLVSSS